MADTIQYSPRRISTAFYCGSLAIHGRNRGGIPSNRGLEIGGSIDQTVYDFFKHGTYRNCKELNYTIMNTPPKYEADPSKPIDFTIKTDIGIFRIGGFTDVTFRKVVIEIKTGEQKKWHEIQALCYAVAEDKPCRILYVSRDYFVTVQPDRDKLRAILIQAWKNEEISLVEKCEHCQNCPIRANCTVWNNRHAAARVLVGLKELIDSGMIPSEDIDHVSVINSYMKQLAGKILEPDIGYQVDGYSITPYYREVGIIESTPMIEIPNTAKCKRGKEKAKQVYMKLTEKSL